MYSLLVRFYMELKTLYRYETSRVTTGPSMGLVQEFRLIIHVNSEAVTGNPMNLSNPAILYQLPLIWVPFPIPSNQLFIYQNSRLYIRIRYMFQKYRICISY